MKNLTIKEIEYNLMNDNFDEVINAFPIFNLIRNLEHGHPAHHLDVLEHTKLALSISEKEPIVRLVLLFHDLGKAEAQVLGLDGVYHYWGHETKSAEIARNFLEILNVDNDYINEICDLIIKHDERFILTREEVFKYIDTLGVTNFEILMKIKMADLLAHSTFHIQKTMPKLILAYQFLGQYKQDREVRIC